MPPMAPLSPGRPPNRLCGCPCTPSISSAGCWCTILLLCVSTNSFPSIGFDRFSIESLSATDAMISAGGQVPCECFFSHYLYGEPFMRSFTIRLHVIQFVGWMVGAALMGCVAFDPAAQSRVENLNDRPSVAILPFGFDLEITNLSAVKTANEMLSPEEESKQVAEALREIQREARWLLMSRLAAGQGFQFVPPEQTDALAEEFQLKPGVLPNPDQLTEFRRRLGADLVVTGSILDY